MACVLPNSFDTTASQTADSPREVWLTESGNSTVLFHPMMLTQK